MVLRRVVVLLGLVLGLAGCASTPPPPAPAPDARAVDVDYARQMIPHHEQALELSALARGRAASPEVADLAFRIDRDQVKEVGQLQGVLRLLGQDPAAPAPGMDAMGMDMGMADGPTLERLRTSSGPTFDRLWLETMTAHHRGAIGMARAHLATVGSGSVLQEFSRTLIPSQQAEVDRMQSLLAA